MTFLEKQILQQSAAEKDSTGEIGSFSCSREFGFVEDILIFLFIPPAYCPEPYELIHGSCFGFFFHPRKTWNNANKYCHGKGGALAGPKSIEALKEFARGRIFFG